MVDTKSREFDRRLERIADELSRTRSALARNVDVNARLRDAMTKLCRHVRESVVQSRKRIREIARRPDRHAAASGASQQGLPSARLRRVLHYIDGSLSERLDVSTLAAVAGMSSGHFAALFKGSTGLTPHRFVLQRRLARSRELLMDESLSIAAIGCQLGFSSQAHFSTAFRQHFHMTPSAFRGSRRRGQIASLHSLNSRIAGRRPEESESHTEMCAAD